MKIINQTKSQKKRRLKLSLKYSLVLLVLLSISTKKGLAQKEKAYVYGKIIDQSSIRIILTSTVSIYKQNKKVGEISNTRNKYEANLLPGIYDIEVSSPGFQNLRKKSIQFANGDSIKCDFNLIADEKSALVINSGRGLEHQDQSGPILNYEASILDSEIRAISRDVKSPSLSIKKDKKLHKKSSPRISTAKYEAYRNKAAKSPFRYPLTRIPLVIAGNMLEDLTSNVSNGKLPKSLKDQEGILIEKLLNSIAYNYPAPQNKKKPFEIYTELLACPWNDDKRLLHIGVQAIKLDSLNAITESNFPIAEEVDINVEFNPAYVTDYKLVGYEDHLPNILSYRVDALMNATMETGQSLTAIYEFTPTQNNFDEVDHNLLYQKRDKRLTDNNELGIVSVFYRPPSGRRTWDLKSKIRRRLKPEINVEEKTFLAVAIAEMAMILKESPFIKQSSISEIIKRLKSLEQLSEEDEIEMRPLSKEGEKVLSLLEEIKKIKKKEE